MSTLRIKNINGTWDKIPILGSAAAVVEAKAQADRAKSEADRAASEAGKFVAGTYYTKTETNSLLSGKADSSTTYTKTETDNRYLPLSGGTLSGKVSIKTDLAERGVPPTVYNNIPLFEMRDKNNKMLGSMGFETTVAGEYRFMLNCYKPNESSGYTNDTISICCDKNGNFYAKAPTPPNTDNSTKIATTAFVNGGNIVAMGDDYIRFGSGLQICWGLNKDTNTTYTIVTYPVAFMSDTEPAVTITVSTPDNSRRATVNAINATSFQIHKSYSDMWIPWVAIGVWK